MAITFSPLPDMPLLEAQEDEVNLSALIEAASDDPLDAIVGMEWQPSVASLPAQFVFSAGVSTLRLDISRFADVFPILEIGYLRHGQIASCTRWADLPVDAEEVVSFRPDPAGVKDFRFTVTARSGLGECASAEYLVRVYANYNQGREALREAVDARR